MVAYTWQELAGLTLRRQFPPVSGEGGPAAVVDAVRRLGPIQSQVARAPFVALAARQPGVLYADIIEAHESFGVVRGSNLRGTVHTCAREHHVLLDSVTRRSLAKDWRRSLKLERVDVAEVQAAMEAYATGEWRTPEQLRAHLADWISRHEAPASVEAASTPGVGRAMAHIHSALIRRPLKDTAWEKQGAPGYRVASDVFGEPPSALLDDPDASLAALTRVHLASYGPANRRDIAWWSGAGLRPVDHALTSLADEVTERNGPDGQTYYDLADIDRQSFDPGVRLLPEYDALVVGYDPKSRDRFFAAEHLQHFWLRGNGAFTSVVLKGGRLVASWRFSDAGPDRRIEVRTFPGAARLAEDELTDSVRAIEAALGVEIVDVTIASA